MTTVAISAPFPGVSRVLEEGEKLGLWRFIRLGDDPEVRLPEADCFLLGAWHPDYPELVKLLPPGARVGVLWTSSMGEMGFEPSEIAALSGLLNNPKVEFIWCGDPAVGALRPPKTFYAPYPLVVEDHRRRDLPKRDAMTLFCPATLKKNLHNQVLAAALVQRESGLVLYTNVPLDNNLVEMLQIRVVRYSWLPRGQYHEVLQAAKLNFAVSFAETLNYQCAESVMLGTPSVVSPTIPFLATQGISKVTNPNDPVEIARVALGLVSNLAEAAELQLECLQDYARTANARLRDELTQRGIAA